MSRGPHVSPYGDVITSALSMRSSGDSNIKLFSNFSLVVGQVIAIYNVDNNDHPYKNYEKGNSYTVYDVMISHPDSSTSILTGCRLAQPTFGGGINNFFEVVQTEPVLKELVEKKTDRSECQAHFVIVGFVNGMMDDAVILGSMPHPNSVAKAARPKKDDKVHTEGEIEGLNFSIDKDGAFTITMQGPKDRDGKHKKKEFEGKKEEVESKLEEKGQDKFPSEDAPTVVKIDKEGNIILTTNSKQRVHVDRVNKKIRIDNAETYINMEQGKDGDARVQIVANNIEIGHSDKTTTKSMKGASKLQPMLVGDDWQQFMEELITEIMAIVVPTGTGPSGTPVNKPKFRALQKRLPDVLSKKHKVEK